MTVRNKASIVLASGSAIRQHMLKSAGLTFSVEPSGIDEDEIAASLTHLPMSARAVALAQAKATAVSLGHPGAYVIGADQMCVLGEEILHKPGTFDKAEAQLAQLAGKTHYQHCGAVILRDGSVLWTCEATASLTMRHLTKAEIHAYIGADAPLASCGSYKFESLGRHLFEKVEGDHDVIKGLPLVSLLAKLHELKVISLS